MNTILPDKTLTVSEQLLYNLKKPSSLNIAEHLVDVLTGLSSIKKNSIGPLVFADVATSNSISLKVFFDVLIIFHNKIDSKDHITTIIPFVYCEDYDIAAKAQFLLFLWSVDVPVFNTSDLSLVNSNPIENESYSHYLSRVIIDHPFDLVHSARSHFNSNVSTYFQSVQNLITMSVYDTTPLQLMLVNEETRDIALKFIKKNPETHLLDLLLTVVQKSLITNPTSLFESSEFNLTQSTVFMDCHEVNPTTIFQNRCLKFLIHNIPLQPQPFIDVLSSIKTIPQQIIGNVFVFLFKSTKSVFVARAAKDYLALNHSNDKHKILLGLLPYIAKLPEVPRDLKIFAIRSLPQIITNESKTSQCADMILELKRTNGVSVLFKNENSQILNMFNSIKDSDKVDILVNAYYALDAMIQAMGIYQDPLVQPLYDSLAKNIIEHFTPNALNLLEKSKDFYNFFVFPLSSFVSYCADYLANHSDSIDSKYLLVYHLTTLCISQNTFKDFHSLSDILQCQLAPTSISQLILAYNDFFTPELLTVVVEVANPLFKQLKTSPIISVTQCLRLFFYADLIVARAPRDNSSLYDSNAIINVISVYLNLLSNLDDANLTTIFSDGSISNITYLNYQQETPKSHLVYSHCVCVFLLQDTIASYPPTILESVINKISPRASSLLIAILSSARQTKNGQSINKYITRLYDLADFTGALADIALGSLSKFTIPQNSDIPLHTFRSLPKSQSAKSFASKILSDFEPKPQRSFSGDLCGLKINGDYPLCVTDGFCKLLNDQQFCENIGDEVAQIALNCCEVLVIPQLIKCLGFKRGFHIARIVCESGYVNFVGIEDVIGDIITDSCTDDAFIVVRWWCSENGISRTNADKKQSIYQLILDKIQSANIFGVCVGLLVIDTINEDSSAVHFPPLVLENYNLEGIELNDLKDNTFKLLVEFYSNVVLELDQRIDGIEQTQQTTGILYVILQLLKSYSDINMTQHILIKLSHVLKKGYVWCSNIHKICQEFVEDKLTTGIPELEAFNSWIMLDSPYHLTNAEFGVAGKTFQPALLTCHSFENSTNTVENKGKVNQALRCLVSLQRAKSQETNKLSLVDLLEPLEDIDLPANDGLNFSNFNDHSSQRFGGLESPRSPQFFDFGRDNYTFGNERIANQQGLFVEPPFIHRRRNSRGANNFTTDFETMVRRAPPGLFNPQDTLLNPYNEIIETEQNNYNRQRLDDEFIYTGNTFLGEEQREEDNENEEEQKDDEERDEEQRNEEEQRDDENEPEVNENEQLMEEEHPNEDDEIEELMKDDIKVATAFGMLEEKGILGKPYESLTEEEKNDLPHYVLTFIRHYDNFGIDVEPLTTSADSLQTPIIEKKETVETSPLKMSMSNEEETTKSIEMEGLGRIQSTTTEMRDLLKSLSTLVLPDHLLTVIELFVHAFDANNSEITTTILERLTEEEIFLSETDEILPIYQLLICSLRIYTKSTKPKRTVREEENQPTTTIPGIGTVQIPPDYDITVFRTLPLEIQREIIEDYYANHRPRLDNSPFNPSAISNNLKRGIVRERVRHTKELPFEKRSKTYITENKLVGSFDAYFSYADAICQYKVSRGVVASALRKKILSAAHSITNLSHLPHSIVAQLLHYILTAHLIPYSSGVANKQELFIMLSLFYDLLLQYNELSKEPLPGIIVSEFSTTLSTLLSTSQEMPHGLFVLIAKILRLLVAQSSQLLPIPSNFPTLSYYRLIAALGYIEHKHLIHFPKAICSANLAPVVLVEVLKQFRTSQLQLFDQETLLNFIRYIIRHKLPSNNEILMELSNITTVTEINPVIRAIIYGVATLSISSRDKLPENMSDFMLKSKSVTQNQLRAHPELLHDLYGILNKFPLYLPFEQKHERLALYVRNKRVNGNTEIVVERENILESLKNALGKATNDVWKKTLKITFAGEQGSDNGGLLKECYSLCAAEIISKNSTLFIAENNTIIPCIFKDITPEIEEKYEFVGKVIAKMIFDEITVDVSFAPYFLRLIFDHPIKLNDLPKIDKQLSSQMNGILNNDVSDYGLYYSVTELVEGKQVDFDLIDNGSNVLVTEENKKDYVDKYVQWKLARRLSRQTSAFAKGFFFVLPQRESEIFDESELNIVISGGEIDVEDLQKHVVYDGYNVDDIQIQWFWSIVFEFDTTHIAQLLQFVTGSTRPPVGGFQNLKTSNGDVLPFLIASITYEDPNSMLPTAHTCANRLEIPRYSTKEILREKLRVAIEECINYEFN
ncbi:HECT-type E3 ubiquitin transferase [Entamoeba marina]